MIAGAARHLGWLRGERRVVAATLVDRSGSTPLDPGATMLIDDAGNVEGSVTGGCVEGALAEEALAILGGAPPRLRRYGVSDELAGEVGLMCGGTVHVFVHEVAGEDRRVLAEALEALERGRPVAIATLLDGPRAGATLALVDGRRLGALGVGEPLDRAVADDVRAQLDTGGSLIRRYAADGARMDAELRVHIRSFTAPPTMAIVGAVDFSAALATLAAQLGYDVAICDPRAPFANSPRFSDVAEVVVAWPDAFLADRKLGPRDAIVVMTHDPKLDEPALLGALASDAGYVGALGSRRTQLARRRRLAEAGVAATELARIAAPCGLDIGPRTPAETAVSILAEIIAARGRRAGGRLADSSGAIRSSGPPPQAPAHGSPSAARSSEVSTSRPSATSSHATSQTPVAARR